MWKKSVGRLLWCVMVEADSCFGRQRGAFPYKNATGTVHLRPRGRPRRGVAPPVTAQYFIGPSQLAGQRRRFRTTEMAGALVWKAESITPVRTDERR